MKEPIRASSFQAKSVQDTDWSSHTLIKLIGSPVGTPVPFTTRVKNIQQPGHNKVCTATTSKIRPMVEPLKIHQADKKKHHPASVSTR